MQADYVIEISDEEIVKAASIRAEVERRAQEAVAEAATRLARAAVAKVSKVAP